MKKKLPTLRSDAAAETFAATADLTQYDLSSMRPVRFEFQGEDERQPRQAKEAVLFCKKEPKNSCS